jgi:hypothetical protein
MKHDESKWYQVLLLDVDGCTIASSEENSLKSAKAAAKRYLSEDWAKDNETSHARLRTEKAQINDENDECIWDEFLDRPL